MSWTKTDHAGLYRHDEADGRWKVHATATHPETGEIVHRRRTLNDVSLDEAIAKREQLKAEIRALEVEREPEAQSIAEFTDRWAEEMVERGRWSQRTADSNRQNLDEHIIPQLGHLGVEELGRKEIRRWIVYAETATYEEGGEAKRYAHASLRRWWRVVKQIVKALYLEAHCDRRLLEWCRDVRGPQSDISGRRETRTLTAEELARYVDKAQVIAPKRYPEIVTLAYTGMRAGELYGLDWAHVDFDTGLIRIEQAYSRGELKGTKTDQARTAPLVPTVAEALTTHRERLVREQNLGLRDGIVFPSENGKRRTSSVLHDPMKAIAKACEIDVKVGPQVLRKTFTTLMGNIGVRREMIKSITGHETNEMHDHYTEIRPEDQVAAVERLFGTQGGETG